MKNVDNSFKENEVNITIKSVTKSVTKYILGEPYFIEGVEYRPEENYNYSEIGLATFYGKELHNIITINNDLNKVTELLGRHKTLPIPSIVKITNLENGLSLTLKINDRHYDNSSLIQISRKSAQLLKFYKKEIAKVKVEIMSDPSKQMKIVTQSMNELTFNDTINSAPTESVSITNINNEANLDTNNQNIESPVEIGFEKIENKDFFLKIYNFKNYDEVKKVLLDLKLDYKFITQKEESIYSLTLGPLNNVEANNLVLSFISKGYKKTEFLFE